MRRKPVGFGIALLCLAAAFTSATIMAAERPRLTLDQLREAEIIGTLGAPLGTCLKVEAEIVREEAGYDLSLYRLKVVRVDGKPLPAATTLDFEIPWEGKWKVEKTLARDAFALYSLKFGGAPHWYDLKWAERAERGYVGSTVTLLAAETGAFDGIPVGLPGERHPSTPKHTFVTHLDVYDVREMKPPAVLPAATPPAKRPENNYVEVDQSAVRHSDELGPKMRTGRPQVDAEELEKKDVVGSLGIPLGVCAEIKAEIVSGESGKTRTDGMYLLKVTHVDGKALAAPATCEFVVGFLAGSRVKLANEVFEMAELQSGKPATSLSDRRIKELEKGYVGRKVKLYAYETGSFQGIPDRNTLSNMYQGHGFMFIRQLVVIDQRD